MSRRLQLKCGAWIFAVVVVLPPYAIAWNIPTHMVHGAMTYQILREENPVAIETVRLILEHHPWQERRWREQLDKLPETERDEILFMLAARWGR